MALILDAELANALNAVGLYHGRAEFDAEDDSNADEGEDGMPPVGGFYVTARRTFADEYAQAARWREQGRRGLPDDPSRQTVHRVTLLPGAEVALDEDLFGAYDAWTHAKHGLPFTDLYGVYQPLHTYLEEAGVLDEVEQRIADEVAGDDDPEWLDEALPDDYYDLLEAWTNDYVEAALRAWQRIGGALPELRILNDAFTVDPPFPGPRAVTVGVRSEDLRRQDAVYVLRARLQQIAGLVARRELLSFEAQPRYEQAVQDAVGILGHDAVQAVVLETVPRDQLKLVSNLTVPQQLVDDVLHEEEGGSTALLVRMLRACEGLSDEWECGPAMFELVKRELEAGVVGPGEVGDALKRLGQYTYGPMDDPADRLIPVLMNSLAPVIRRVGWRGAQGGTTSGPSLPVSPRLPATTGSRSFIQPGWVPDLSGTFFHGTRVPGLTRLKASVGGEFGPGVYLTDFEPTVEMYAERFARGPGEPEVLRVRTSARQPYVVRKTDWIAMTMTRTPREVQAQLKAEGYDSIVGIAINDYEWQLLVFDPDMTEIVEDGSTEFTTGARVPSRGGRPVTSQRIVGSTAPLPASLAFDPGMMTLEEYIALLNPAQKKHSYEAYDFDLFDMNQRFAHRYLGKAYKGWAHRDFFGVYESTAGIFFVRDGRPVGVLIDGTLYFDDHGEGIGDGYTDQNTSLPIKRRQQVKYISEYMPLVDDLRRFNTEKYPVVLQHLIVGGEPMTLRAKDAPTVDGGTSLAILDSEGRRVALAQDEWGATLVAVAQEVRGRGLGKKISEAWYRFNPSFQSGGMTPQGESLAVARWADRVREFRAQGWYSALIRAGRMTPARVKEIFAGLGQREPQRAQEAGVALSGTPLVMSDGHAFVTVYDRAVLDDPEAFSTNPDERFVYGHAFLRDSPSVGVFVFRIDYDRPFAELTTRAILQLARDQGHRLYDGEGYSDLLEGAEDLPGVVREGDYLVVTEDLLPLHTLAGEEREARRAVDPYRQLEAALAEAADTKWR